MAQWERRAKCYKAKCVENIDLQPKSNDMVKTCSRPQTISNGGTRNYKCMWYENPSLEITYEFDSR